MGILRHLLLKDMRSRIAWKSSHRPVSCTASMTIGAEGRRAVGHLDCPRHTLWDVVKGPLTQPNLKRARACSDQRPTPRRRTLAHPLKGLLTLNLIVSES